MRISERDKAWKRSGGRAEGVAIGVGVGQLGQLCMWARMCVSCRVERRGQREGE